MKLFGISIANLSELKVNIYWLMVDNIARVGLVVTGEMKINWKRG
jgi:hypothetical protein